MARMHTDEESREWIEKRAPEHVRRYVAGIEKLLSSKQEYIESMENGLFGEREGDAENFYFTEHIRSNRPGEPMNTYMDKRWLPLYTDVGVKLSNGDEIEIRKGYQYSDRLTVKLGADTRGTLAVVSSGSHGSLDFMVIRER